MNKWMEELSKKLLGNNIEYTFSSIGPDFSCYEFIVSEENYQAAKDILENHVPSSIRIYLMRG